MDKLFYYIFGSDKKSLADEDGRYFLQTVMLMSMLGSICLLMGILNLFIVGSVLAGIDIFFSAICFINYFILRTVKKASLMHYIIFACLLIGFLIVLLVTGGTAGYGSFWILFLPACGMSLLGLKRGATLSAVMLFVVLLLLWSPFGKGLLLYEYSEQFYIMFPVAYAVIFSVGYCVEALRWTGFQEMLKIQRKLQDIAERDSLTGAANRIWFDKHFIERYNGKPMPTASLVFLIDIDDFKRVNDTYGHLAGDEIICRSVDTIRETIGNNILCRWGGEEFFSFIPFSNIEEAKPLLEKIRKSVESTRYRYKEYDDIRITISICCQA